MYIRMILDNVREGIFLQICENKVLQKLEIIRYKALEWSDKIFENDASGPQNGHRLLYNSWALHFMSIRDWMGFI